MSSNISGCTGPIFAIISPYESALDAGDGSVPYPPICQGTLPWQPNNFAVMKVNWLYVHSLQFARWSSFVSLLLARGDTVALSGLLARLCHAFLVFLFFTLSKIGLLDRFSRSLHQMEGICVNFLIRCSFSDSSRDVAMATNFVAKLPTPLHLSLWHSETKWDNAVYMHD